MEMINDQNKSEKNRRIELKEKTNVEKYVEIVHNILYLKRKNKVM